jgi:hypothetical protein
VPTLPARDAIGDLAVGDEGGEKSEGDARPPVGHGGEEVRAVADLDVGEVGGEARAEDEVRARSAPNAAADAAEHVPRHLEP